MGLQLTQEELFAYLKNSDLDTILVEGKNDATIYRWLEDEISTTNISILHCNGRETLLNVYEKRKEVEHIRLFFIADKDKYVYTGVPKDYEDVFWTEGYSIENDLYFGGYLESLLDSNEKENFNKALTNFIRKYAIDIYEIKCGNDTPINYHPQEILDNNFELKIAVEEIEEVNPTTRELTENYQLKIRGKSLFAILFLFLGNRRRRVKHNKNSLMEICLKCNDKNLVNNIKNRIIAEYT